MNWKGSSAWYRVASVLAAAVAVAALAVPGRGQGVPKAAAQPQPQPQPQPKMIVSTPARPAAAPARTGRAVAPPAAPASGYPPCFIPRDLHDLSFDRHVDLLLLGAAWDQHDSDILTDIGLQLAEGERVLMRSHKALEAGKVLEVAAHVAGDRKDDETLDRLARAATTLKNARLTAAVEDARKVASTTADVHHKVGHSIEEMSPQALAMHQAAIRKIRALRLAGDREKLEHFDKHIDSVGLLHEGQQGHLDHEIAKARTNIAKDDSLRHTIDVLDRLAAQTPCTKID